MDNNQALHEAIEKDDMEKFLNLLLQPGVDLNCKNEDGITPLTATLFKEDGSMAQCLIEAGCDVNLKDAWERSPLYEAILHKVYHQYQLENSFIEMLLQRGADINAQNEINGDTSLHLAVSSGDLEVTSLLLYYGADVNITNNLNETSLMKTSDYGVGKLLLNYYDDFSCRREGIGHTAIHTAVQVESPLVVDLVKRGANVNELDADGKCLLYYTKYHQHAQLFKFIWSKIDHQLVLNMNPPFLLHYMQESFYSISEFYECLYLVLDSAIARFLVQECRIFYEHEKYSYMKYLLQMAINAEPKDRLSLIYSYLSLGVEIKIDDLQYAYQHYGFNAEFKALLYAGNLSCYDYAKQVRYCIRLQGDFYKKGFSSLSFENKQLRLVFQSELQLKEILEAWSEVPEFPSLFELSRNEAQNFIQQKFSFTKLYQYYDAVKSSKLPQLMQDVILLEKPIYKILESRKNLHVVVND